ncbi:MAG: AMP-binding protein [Burkholderiaceae bacterium]
MPTRQDLLDRFTESGEFVVDQLDRWVRERPQARCLYYGEEDRLLRYAEFGALTDSIGGFLAARGLQPGEPLGVLTRNPMTAALAMFGAWKAGVVYAPVNFAFTGRLLVYQLNDTGAGMLVVDDDGLRAVLEVWDDLRVKPVLVRCPPRADDRRDAAGTTSAETGAGAYTKAGAGTGAKTNTETGAATAVGIGAGATAAAVPAVPAGIEVLDWRDACAGHPRPTVTLSAHSPCQIVYTSGTTGPSKGVLLPHRWIAQYTFVVRLTMTQDDVIYNDLPMYHVGAASFNLARAIWVGCEFACWDRFSPTQFWDRVRKVGATTAILLDAMIPWLMKAPPRDDDRANTLNKAHMQPLPLNHHEVARRFGIDVVTCGFGQTESGNGVATIIEELALGEGTPPALFRGHDRAARTEALSRYGIRQVSPQQADAKGFMGWPTPFFDAAVVDENDEFRPVGEAGQLVLRPRIPNTIFLEYLGKPEATAKALRNAWFHTGDAVLQRADGSLVFVDRLGDRIRVRGENLSSYHVEDLFHQHPSVAICAAFAVPAAEGDEDDIVLYVVRAEGAGETAQDLLAWAESAMPKFMRPRHVRFIDDLPRTATNKIEKYKLRAAFAAERQDAPGRS